jgi:hypothetical protein
MPGSDRPDTDTYADLARTASKTLAQDGYCVLGRVLRPGQVAQLRDAVDRIAAAKPRPAPPGWRSPTTSGSGCS